MGEIVVIGSLNMDLVVDTDVLPMVGETVKGSAFTTIPGGKGANQAVAAARLGGDVKMIGRVGADSFGDELLKSLNDSGVDTVHVKKIPNKSTGIAAITVSDGNNSIIVVSGANGELVEQEAPEIEQVIANAKIIMLQLEIPFETVWFAIRCAKKHGVKVLLNPAPAAEISDEILALTTIFTPNETECAAITGMEISDTDDAKKAVKFLLTKGIETVIVTLGANGVVYNNGDVIVHKPAHKVKPVDTTAAGDSFSAAIAVGITEGMDIDSAVELASKVGSLTVTKKGAQSSLPFRQEVGL